jgi:2-isopropylmalate synthase
MTDKKITVYDTTLRDGAQTRGISFSLEDKLRIAVALDSLKVDYIEGGYPGSNPKDDLFFEQIKSKNLTHSKIAAFGSTRRKNTTCEEDALVQALVNSGADVCTIVAKTCDFQVTTALGISLEENLSLIRDTVAYLKKKGKTAFIDCEHYYDGFKANREYALKCISTAIEAGVDMAVLCDTNGGTLPHEVSEITAATVKACSVPVGVHFHNDTNVAVANSLAAILAGAASVQGTVNGYGERCGNCDLMSFIPNASIKMGYEFAAAGTMTHLTEVSRFVAETANLGHNERLPYVGASAFAHKGGIHVSALQRDTRTYEHIDPALVGNKRQVLISELAGKSNIEFKAEELGVDLTKDPVLAKAILNKVKKLEDRGYTFEAANGSFELIVRGATGDYSPFFSLKGFRVITEMNEKGVLECEATIKVEVSGQVEHTAANGNGPVAALDSALRKALEKFYPEIGELQLTDYKVRVLNEKDGTGSKVRVLIDLKRDSESWGTVGVSTNIIEASWQAMVDGVEYMLYRNEKNKGNRA